MVNTLEKQLGEYKLKAVVAGGLMSSEINVLNHVVDGKVSTPSGFERITELRYVHNNTYLSITYQEYLDLDKPNTLEGKATYTKKD